MTRPQYATGLAFAVLIGATLGYLVVMAIVLLDDATARDSCGRQYDEGVGR